MAKKRSVSKKARPKAATAGNKKPPDAKKAPVAGKPASSGAAPSLGEQSTLYDQAIEAFHGRDFKKALALFRRVEGGPDDGLQHRARVHAAMCEQRLDSKAPKLSSAEDLYNYGVRLINDRELEAAEAQLEKALEKSPDGAHIHYALGVAAALREDSEGALTRLKRAIELDPAQRLLARGDADLAAVVRHPEIAELLNEHNDIDR